MFKGRFRSLSMRDREGEDEELELNLIGTGEPLKALEQRSNAFGLWSWKAWNAHPGLEA